MINSIICPDKLYYPPSLDYGINSPAGNELPPIPWLAEETWLKRCRDIIALEQSMELAHILLDLTGIKLSLYLPTYILLNLISFSEKWPLPLLLPVINQPSE